MWTLDPYFAGRKLPLRMPTREELIAYLLALRNAYPKDEFRRNLESRSYRSLYDLAERKNVSTPNILQPANNPFRWPEPPPSRRKFDPLRQVFEQHRQEWRERRKREQLFLGMSRTLH
jgi:predicted DNA-binding transcriptional regulator YafY